MNHGHDASRRHCGRCILEHSGRRLTGISLAPVVSVKGISKFLLKNEVRIRRYLRASIPDPRQFPRWRVHLKRHVAKAAATNQHSIGFTQHSERTQF
jgi:hypothetical protein